ncbi:RHS repeat-associated core domain-containing protein [Stenotrophomonas bentonitica]|uniref:RHS repeat-associated core domain-containing protein n=1 Tax=Stenotrophomonas bentonitica TaxID=1450134 RepID=UPI00345E0B34
MRLHVHPARQRGLLSREVTRTCQGITMPQIPSATPTHATSSIAHFRYDAESLLSRVDSAGSKQDRYWRDDRVVAEAGTQDLGTYDPVSWLWIADQPVAELRPARSAASFLLATDASLSPALELGDEPYGMAYAPHGHRATTSLRPVSPLAQLGFNGEMLDAASELYLLGPRNHRPYSPTLGMFLAPDPMSPFQDGGMNGLAYCQGDPVNRADPTGNFWKWIMAGVAVVAAVASFGALAVVGVTASAVVGAVISTAAAAVEIAAATVEDELAQEVLGYVGIGLTAAGVVAALPAMAKAGTQLASKGKQFVQRLASARPQKFAETGMRTTLKAWPISTPARGSQTSIVSVGEDLLGSAQVGSDDFIDIFQGHGARFLTGTKKNVSGGKLASIIRKSFGKDHVFQRMELQSCRTTFGGKYASQAQRVADKLGVPTTGFQGTAEFAPNMGRARNFGTRRIMEPQTGWRKRRTAILNGVLSRLMGLRYQLTSI